MNKKWRELRICPTPASPGTLLRRSCQDFIKANFADHWRGRRLLVDWLDSHLFCFLLLFRVVHFGIFRRLPSNIWESFSHQMMGRQPSITPLNPTPLSKTARLHACTPLTAWSGATSRDVLLLHSPFCQGSSSLGLEAHVKESNFPCSLPPKQLPLYRKMHFSAPLPTRPHLEGGFGGPTTAGDPLLPPAPRPVHHTPLREGIRKSCCFGWIKIQTFCPKLTTCSKTGRSDGMEDVGAFPEKSLPGGS